MFTFRNSPEPVQMHDGPRLKQSNLIMNCRGALDLMINKADFNENEWLILNYSDLDFMFVLLMLLS